MGFIRDILLVYKKRQTLKLSNYITVYQIINISTNDLHIIGRYDVMISLPKEEHRKACRNFLGLYKGINMTRSGGI